MIDLLLLVMLSALVGTSLGVLTGLIPGLHVNNVAIILLSLSPLAVSVISDWGVEKGTVYLMVASSIVATSMAHTFLDFIPSTFLGAPEGDTALSVLPAHGMLLEGRGYSAVVFSAVGSFGAVVMGVLLLVPYKLLVNEPLNGYMLLKEYMVWVLMGVCLLMLLTETSRIPYRPVRGEDGTLRWEDGTFSRTVGVMCAMMLFILAGGLGLVVLDLPVRSPLGLPATVLFPTLSGLFGTSTLIISARDGAVVPPQTMEAPDIYLKEAGPSIVSGGVAGSVVGFLPGMSGGVATVVAMLFRKDPKPESVIITLSAINTANSLFVLGALFLILRPRSGAAIVVNDLVSVTRWDDVLPPQALSLLLISALIASSLGFFLTLFLGKRFANIMPRIPYPKLAWGIVIFIALMVFAFTGPLGFFVLLVSTCVGMVAPMIGIRRSHAMGVLLVPVMVMLW